MFLFHLRLLVIFFVAFLLFFCASSLALRFSFTRIFFPFLCISCQLLPAFHDHILFSIIIISSSFVSSGLSLFFPKSPRYEFFHFFFFLNPFPSFLSSASYHHTVLLFWRHFILFNMYLSFWKIFTSGFLSHFHPPHPIPSQTRAFLNNSSL